MAELVDLGSQGLRVPRLGLGIMSAAFYGSGSPADDELQQLAAIDKLVEICSPSPCFIDTAFLYAHPTGLHSEAIVGKAIAKHGREKFVIATKFGITMQGPDSSTETIQSQYAASVARLGCAPDLYYQHRPDPKRSMKDVMTDLKNMHSEGKFKFVGLSECTPNELREAHSVFPVSCVQMEWSLAERGIEKALIPVCKELGVSILGLVAPLAEIIPASPSPSSPASKTNPPCAACAFSAAMTRRPWRGRSASSRTARWRGASSPPPWPRRPPSTPPTGGARCRASPTA